MQGVLLSPKSTSPSRIYARQTTREFIAEEKEGELMIYTKPEVELLAEAFQAIQGSTNKFVLIVQESSTPVAYGTSAAYEADE